MAELYAMQGLRFQVFLKFFLTFPNFFPTCPQLFSSNFHQHQDETKVEWKISDLCAMEGLREGITSPHTCYYQQDQDF